MRLSLRDTSNFYYLLRVPSARLPYQGVGPSVSRSWYSLGCPWPVEDLKEIYGGGDLVQPTLLVVLQGDLNGVHVGQEVHRNLLLQNQVYDLSEEIMLGRPPPRGKTWVAPYIDDLASTHIAPKHEIFKGAFARDTAIMDKADIICSKAGLLEKAGKDKEIWWMARRGGR